MDLKEDTYEQKIRDIFEIEDLDEKYLTLFFEEDTSVNPTYSTKATKTVFYSEENNEVK